MTAASKKGFVLFDAFNPAQVPSQLLSAEFNSIETDSRLAKPGCLFVATKGTRFDSHAAVPELYKKGVRSFVVEEDVKGVPPDCLFKVSDAASALGLLASAWYGNPSQELDVIGVTGTSGKTTTTFLIEKVLGSLGRKVGLIGTVVFRFQNQVFPSTHTTPGQLELQSLLRQMCDAGCDTVVMEVSSHALSQRRTSGVVFDHAVFLNLSPEHLDFHPNMEEYYQAKKLLFGYDLKSAHVNRESPEGLRLSQEIKSETPRVALSLFSKKDFQFQATASGLKGRTPAREYVVPLFGEFNSENVNAAVSVCQALGFTADQILSQLAQPISVPGRLERVQVQAGRDLPTVFVDYAHKPDALGKVLETLRQVLPKGAKLWTVFGCGGDRDKTKRPVMGAIAARLSDHLVVTSDNPRTEDPDQIIREILAAIPLEAKTTVEVDRAKAIEFAVRSARKEDWILIAGKGHEDYQIIADRDAVGSSASPAQPAQTKKIHFDDREVASLALNLRNQ